MSHIEKLPVDVQTKLISVPYRIGIWISNVDDVEARKADDKREQKVLELAITKMATAHRKMPFAAAVMQKVEASKGHWQSWEGQADESSVLGDLEHVIQSCEQHLKPAAVKQYKQAVWQTAILVAQAFNEDYDPDGEMLVNHFAEWIGSIFTAPKLKKAPENMSAKEKTALKKLRAVLKQ